MCTFPHHPGLVCFPSSYHVQWAHSWCSGKESASQCGRHRGCDPWVGRVPWRREWQPTSVFLPGKSHGRRSLVGYSPGDHKESCMTYPVKKPHHHHHAKYLWVQRHSVCLLHGQGGEGYQFKSHMLVNRLSICAPCLSNHPSPPCPEVTGTIIMSYPLVYWVGLGFPHWPLKDLIISGLLYSFQILLTWLLMTFFYLLSL